MKLVGNRLAGSLPLWNTCLRTLKEVGSVHKNRQMSFKIQQWYKVYTHKKSYFQRCFKDMRQFIEVVHGVRIGMISRGHC